VEAVRRRIEIGVASMTMAGETESADRHMVREDGSRTLIAVVDGLGHGNGAVRAAVTAVASLESEPLAPLVPMVLRLHDRLRGTRGVVLSLAVADLAAGQLQWLGVGNVAGVLVHRTAGARREPQENLVPLGGIVGSNLPPLSPVTLPIEAGDTLVFATDGVDVAFDGSIAAAMPAQRLAQVILATYGRPKDDALVLVARFSEDPS
jgi:negative regulator of sigma-B (phosphoserine phosphatase)